MRIQVVAAWPMAQASMKHRATQNHKSHTHTKCRRLQTEHVLTSRVDVLLTTGMFAKCILTNTW